MVDVVLLGSGGTRPLPGRGLTSLVIRYGGSMLLFDCGEGTQVNFARGGVNVYPVESIFITHLHADHILGFPGLLATLVNMSRRKPLKVFGPKGTKTSLVSLVNASGVSMHGLPFRVDFYEYHQKEECFDFGVFRVDCFSVKHSIDCYGYAFTEIRPAYFCTDRIRGVLPEECWTAVQEGHEVRYGGRVWSRHDLFGDDRQGIKVVYATDTRPADTLTKYAVNSTLLVLEGMYVGNSEEDVKNSESTKHMTMREAADIAKSVHARELWLTHLSPSISSMRTLPECIEQVFRNTCLGYDGLSTMLEHSDIIPLVYKGHSVYQNVVSGETDTVEIGYGVVGEGDVFGIAENGREDSDRILVRAVGTEDTGDGMHIKFEVLRE